MKPAQTLFSFRHMTVFAVAGAALLSASGAFAQTPSPYSFDIQNDTLSGGDPVFSVTNALTFSNLQINETFANGFTQAILLPSLDTNLIDEQTNQFLTNSALTSATLTGSFGSVPQTVSLETTIGGPITPQYVSSSFSASLFGPVTAGTALGTFGLLDGNGNVTRTVNIIAPAAVPEASTTVSLGLLLALGLGALAVTRRRAVTAK